MRRLSSIALVFYLIIASEINVIGELKTDSKEILCIPRPANARWINWPVSERELKKVDIDELINRLTTVTETPLINTTALTTSRESTALSVSSSYTSLFSTIPPHSSSVFMRLSTLTTDDDDEGQTPGRVKPTKFVSETTCPPVCNAPQVPLKEDLIRMMRQMAELSDSGLFTRLQFAVADKEIRKLVEELKRVNIIENVLKRDEFEVSEENKKKEEEGQPDYCQCAPEDRCHKLKTVTIKEYRNIYKTYEY